MKEDRIFTTKDNDDNEWILKFKRPTQSAIRHAELVYRSGFSKALKAGILLSSEITSILEERGVWDDDKEEEGRVMRNEIEQMEETLKDNTLSNDQGKAVCERIGELREKLQGHNNAFTSVSDNTCESFANEERNKYLVSECIYDNKTSVKVYKDVEDFNNRMNEISALDAYKETVIAALEVVVGKDLPSDLTSDYAENKWLASREVIEETMEIKPKKKRSKKVSKAE